MRRPFEDAELENLHDRLKDDPTNLALADSYWKALSRYKGRHDIRSGRDVVEAYAEAALKSTEGVVAFASAYRELFELSGEAPRAAYFDENLVRALGSWLPHLPEAERANLQWVLGSISNR